MKVFDTARRRDAGTPAGLGSAVALVFVALGRARHVLDTDRVPVDITISEYVVGPHGRLFG